MPAGMLYPRASLWLDDDRTLVKHHQLNYFAHGDRGGRRARDRFESSSDRLSESLAASAAEARSRAVDGRSAMVLVAEGLSHQSNPAGVTAELMRHVDEVDYVLVARRQPRAIGSLIAHSVKDIRAVDRWHLTAEKYLSRSRRLHRFDYASILDTWRHDGATLHVMPFDEAAPGTTTLTDGIFDRLDLPRVPQSKSLSTRRTHPSFSEEGLRELAAIKRRHRWMRWAPGADERYQAVFSSAWERHHLAARNGTVQPWRLSVREEARVRADYVGSNARFRELLGDEAATPPWDEWFASVGLDVDPTTLTEGRA